MGKAGGKVGCAVCHTPKCGSPVSRVVAPLLQLRGHGGLQAQCYQSPKFQEKPEIQNCV